MAWVNYANYNYVLRDDRDDTKTRIKTEKMIKNYSETISISREEVQWRKQQIVTEIKTI